MRSLDLFLERMHQSRRLPAAVCAATLFYMALVIGEVHYIFTAAPANDAGIFLTVGRGMLNGLRPYVDLFETKPLGMFVLSAAALAASPDARLIFAFHAMAFLGIIAAATLLAWSAAEELDNRKRLMVAAVGFMFGTALALFTVMVSGIFVAEPFGAFFGCVYACVLASRLHWSKKMVLATLAMTATLLFKEPFLFSILAVAVLLLAPRMREVIYAGTYPFILTFLLLRGIYSYAGVLSTYIGFYIPFMLHARLGDTTQWTQGFRVAEVLKALWGFSPALLLMCLLTLVVPFAFLSASGDTAQKRRSVIIQAARLLAGVVLFSFAAMTGDHVRSYQIFAVPAYFALFALALGYCRWHEWNLRGAARTMVAVFLLSLLAFPVLPGITTTIFSAPEPQNRWHADQRLARELDAITDRCGFSRYLFFGSASGYIYGHTKHSPLGPGFFMEMHHLRSPLLFNGIVGNIDMAQIILFKKMNSNMGAEQMLYAILEQKEKDFTLTPPACAGGDTINTDQFVLLFRKTPDTVQAALLPLSAYIEQLIQYEAISIWEVNDIKRAVRREFGINAAIPLVLTVERGKENVKVTVLDGRWQAVLGAFRLRRADGAILAKWAPHDS